MYKLPYILYTKSFRSRNKAVTDSSPFEETTPVLFTFQAGIHLPGVDEKGFGLSKHTLRDPKDYNIVFGSSLPIEDLLAWDMLPRSYAAPLVKKKIVDFLSAICPEDFQAFPVKIRTSLPETKDLDWDMKNPAYWTNPICEDFFILNITHWADILDHKKAWISGMDEDNTFLHTHNTVFREDATLSPHHIARVKFHVNNIAVSPELAKAMKKAGFKGPKFRPWTDIPQYRDPPEGWKGKCPCPKCVAQRAQKWQRLKKFFCLR